MLFFFLFKYIYHYYYFFYLVQVGYVSTVVLLRKGLISSTESKPIPLRLGETLRQELCNNARQKKLKNEEK